MEEIWRWSAGETATHIRSRDVSVTEVTGAILQRLEAVNSRINAVVELTEGAMDVAAEMDAQGVPEDAGPLYGVPITTKINVDQAGHATSNGIPLLAGRRVDQDSAVVANLRAAGAVLIGRNNAPEFSMRYHTSNPLHGVTRNPHYDVITPGGSSGGAAAAVAGGVGSLAHGNDMGGSLRYPAYCCGVTGLRPSQGRVPSFNPAAPGERPGLSQTLSVQGPIARSVADLRLGLQAMARGDSRDPFWRNATGSGRLRNEILRVGICADPFSSPHPEVMRAVRSTEAALRDIGMDVREVRPPDLDRLVEVYSELGIGEGHSMSGEATLGLLSDQMRAIYGITLDHFGPKMDLPSLLAAIRDRVTIQRNWSLMFDDVDLLVMPVSAELPFALEEDWEEPELVRREFLANRPLSIVNVLGLPSLALPTHLTDGGPCGIQLIGPYMDDWLVLDVAERLEAVLGVKLPFS